MYNGPKDTAFHVTDEVIIGKGGRKVRAVAGVLVFCGALLLALPSLLARLTGGGRPPDLSAALVPPTLGLVCLALANSMWSSAVVHIWSIGDDGIACQGFAGRGQRLAWGEVERVRWSSEVVRFQGRTGHVILPWRIIPVGRRAEVGERIAGYLPAFDLPPSSRMVRRTTALNGLMLGWLLLSLWASFCLVRLLGLRLVPASRRSGWGDSIFVGALMAVWVTLGLLLNLPTFRLASRQYWIDRRR